MQIFLSAFEDVPDPRARCVDRFWLRRVQTEPTGH